MDNCLIDSLVEQVANGKKSGHCFKKERYKPCVDNIRDKLGIILTSKNVINLLRTVKKLYFTIQDLHSASGFEWDDSLKVVVATDDVWVDYIKSHPYAQHVRGKLCLKYDDLEYIFGDDHATGKRCATGNYSFDTVSFGGLRDPDDPMT
ncbi:uncharacterized protein At2g29880-like [Magnolia sinica]|uniref:uncharacterized protein At2g29880-like n=1 Tax=Magnolia sinica TaxID=86752 RepID=UPI00265A75A8|nr:uncharacterized protein At2g29880-like [Magnolia sinica]